jgi:hypothetical protein
LKIIKTVKVFHILIIISFIVLVTNIDLLFSIPANQITDRNNYHIHVQDGKTWLAYVMSIGFPLFFFSEPVSKFIYFLLNICFTSEQFSIKILIFLQLYLTFYIVRRNSVLPFYWIIVIFLTPPVLVNYIMTLRQGLASMFFLFFFFSTDYRKFLWLSICPLIHFLFYGVLSIFFLSKLESIKSKPVFSLFLFFLFSLFFSFFSNKIIIYFNLSYFEVDSNEFKLRFGFQIVYWFLILVLFINEGNSFLRNNLFVSFIIAFYLASVFIVPQLSRILDSLSILIFLTGFQLTGKNLFFYKSLVLLFAFYQLFMFITNASLGSMMLNE